MATTPMDERAVIRAAVVRMRARIMAIVFGMVGGTAVFVATAWLLLQGGENVGQHLGLLGNYMPGYYVNWPGALVGFCWGALYGGIIGFAVAWIYNQVVEARAE
jgi:hypothetical protein